jgi:hypothetical protein
VATPRNRSRLKVSRVFFVDNNLEVDNNLSQARAFQRLRAKVLPHVLLPDWRSTVA